MRRDVFSSSSGRAVEWLSIKDSEIMLRNVVFQQIYRGLAKWLFSGIQGAIYKSGIYGTLN